MATKIRNIELLTLARSDAGTPVLGHVGVGIDANLIQDFEMGLSRVSSAAQFNLALNVEGATTNTAHYGGIAFTQGASADTVMASIKAVNTSVDGYVDLSFNTRSVSNVLYIQANGGVGVGTDSVLNNFSAGSVATKFAVVTSSAGAGYHEAVHIAAGSDSDNTGAILRLGHYGNDRGLYVKAGRGSSDRAIARFGLRDSGAADNDILTLAQEGSIYRVGIGTILPDGQLHVHSTRPSVQRLILSNSNPNLNPQQRIEFWEHASTATSANANAAIEYVGVGTYESSDGTLLIKGLGVSADLPIAGFNRNGNVYLGMSGNKKVGIGTLSPDRLLELSDDTNGAVDLFRLTNADATYSQTVDFSLDTNKDLVVAGGSGAGGIHFNMGSRGYTFSNGNVGIGMTPGSTYGLYVSGKPVKFISDGAASSGAVLELVHANNDSTDVVSTIAFANNAGSVAHIRGGTTSANDNGYISFQTDNSGTTAERLRIDYDGQTYFYGQLNIPGGSGSTTNRLNFNYNSSNGVAEIAPDSSSGHTELKFSTCLSGTKSERMRIHHDGKVGVGTGSTTLTELLEVNGNAKATKFIGALEGNADTATALETARTIHGVSFDGTGNIDLTEVVQDTVGAMFTSNTETGITVAYQDSDGTIDLTVGTLNQDTTGNAATATTLETARNIVVGKSAAGAGDIDAITQSFDGSANISFDSELNSHLPADLRNTASTNIADEPGNTALKIIGSASKAVQLKINRQGLIVGFDEATITGGGGGGSSFDVSVSDEIYFDSAYTDQTTKTIDSSNPDFSLHFNSEALFTSLTESSGTMSIEIGGTTKTLDLPDASFTELALNTNSLQITVGSTQKTLDLGGLSVTSATNATNADNIAISSENTNATRYLSFVNGTSGDRALKVDSGLTYNPSTNTLTTTNFSGALSGNSTTSSGLLVGSTTYLGSVATANSTIVLRDAQGDINARYLQGSYVNTSDNVPTSNISYIMAKFGDNYHRSATASKVRNFLDPNNTRFLPAPNSVDGVNIYTLTVTNATSAGSATNAGSAVSISAGEGNQAFSGVTNDGFVKLSTVNGTEGVLSVGALESDDIPDNSANTSGKADTAGEAETLTLGEDSVAASIESSADTVVVRGVNGVVNVGNLFCNNIGSSTSAAGNITAESLTVTNATNSIVAKEIMPKGTATVVGTFDALFGAYDNWIGNDDTVATYVVTDTRLGDYTDSDKGAFNEASFLYGFSQWSSVVSDRRIKENIESFGLGLDFVRLLEPKKYNYIGSSSPRVHHGVVAQEIEEALDALGVENHSFINIPGYHEKSEEEKEKATKTYNTQDVMWVLFNAVKQLDAEVQELKKQLDKSE